MQTPRKDGDKDGEKGKEQAKSGDAVGDRKLDLKSINLNFTPIAAIKGGSHLITSVMKEHEQRKKLYSTQKEKEGIENRFRDRDSQADRNIDRDGEEQGQAKGKNYGSSMQGDKRRKSILNNPSFHTPSSVSSSSFSLYQQQQGLASASDIRKKISEIGTRYENSANSMNVRKSESITTSNANASRNDQNINLSNIEKEYLQPSNSTSFSIGEENGNNNDDVDMDNYPSKYLHQTPQEKQNSTKIDHNSTYQTNPKLLTASKNIRNLTRSRVKLKHDITSSYSHNDSIYMGDDNEEEDILHVKYGTKIMLRNSKGHCLAIEDVYRYFAKQKDEKEDRSRSVGTGDGISISGANANSGSNNNNNNTYVCTAEGVGTSTPKEVCHLVNATKKDSCDRVRYTDCIALRFPAAKEKFIAFNNQGQGNQTNTEKNVNNNLVSLTRNLIGSKEKWYMVRADDPSLIFNNKSALMKGIQYNNNNNNSDSNSNINIPPSTPLHQNQNKGQCIQSTLFQTPGNNSHNSQHRNQHMPSMTPLGMHLTRAAYKLNITNPEDSNFPKTNMNGNQYRSLFLKIGDFVVLRTFRGEGVITYTNNSCNNSQNYNRNHHHFDNDSQQTNHHNDNKKNQKTICVLPADDVVSVEDCVWEICLAGTPYYPAYIQSRPYLTGNFKYVKQLDTQVLKSIYHYEYEENSNPSTKTDAISHEKTKDKIDILPQTRLKKISNKLSEECNLSLYERLFGLTKEQVVSTLADKEEFENANPKLGLLTTQEQEYLLLDDVLSAMSGYEGRYIKIQSIPPSSSSSSCASEGYEQYNNSGNSCNNRYSNIEGLQNGITKEFAIVDYKDQDTTRIDISLKQILRSFLPLFNMHLHIISYIDIQKRYEYGLCAQAFASAIKTLLHEYYILIAQLEHLQMLRKLSLQKVWYLIQNSVTQIKTIYQLVIQLRGKKGGQLLNVIKTSRNAVDSKTVAIYDYVLSKASEPYLKILVDWVNRGTLEDPYQDFMIHAEGGYVKDNISLDYNDEYWNERYTIKDPTLVFDFLEDYQEKILIAGKYLNVLRECDNNSNQFVLNNIMKKNKSNTLVEVLDYTMGESVYIQCIESAYTRSCALLLDLLMNKYNLVHRLNSVKHYFLLDKGDFFVHFMNVAKRELHKGIENISRNRINSLLNVSIQMSCIGNLDLYKDDVYCVFSEMNLISHMIAIHGGSFPSHGVDSCSTSTPDNLAGSMGIKNMNTSIKSNNSNNSTTGNKSRNREILKGYETFMLDYQVQWPLSLIISKRAITKYQLLFRHFFYTKYVEHQLHQAWLLQQGTKGLNFKRLQMVGSNNDTGVSVMRKFYLLRQRMLHFLENYIHYMLYEVVEPHWHNFIKNIKGDTSKAAPNMKKVQNVDDVIKLHSGYQDTCLKECLLTNIDLLQILHQILTTCIEFEKMMTETFEQSEKARSQVAEIERDKREIQILEEEEEDGSKNYKSKKDPKKSNSSTPRKAKLAQERVNQESDLLLSIINTEKYHLKLVNIEKDFDLCLGKFMQRIWIESRNQYHTYLANLSTRLDYNGYLAARYGKDRITFY